jgi:hypothetical protein
VWNECSSVRLAKGRKLQRGDLETGVWSGPDREFVQAAQHMQSQLTLARTECRPAPGAAVSADDPAWWAGAGHSEDPLASQMGSRLQAWPARAAIRVQVENSGVRLKPLGSAPFSACVTVLVSAVTGPSSACGPSSISLVAGPLVSTFTAARTPDCAIKAASGAGAPAPGAGKRIRGWPLVPAARAAAVPSAATGDVCPGSGRPR